MVIGEVWWWMWWFFVAKRCEFETEVFLRWSVVFEKCEKFVSGRIGSAPFWNLEKIVLLRRRRSMVSGSSVYRHGRSGSLWILMGHRVQTVGECSCRFIANVVIDRRCVTVDVSPDRHGKWCVERFTCRGLFEKMLLGRRCWHLMIIYIVVNEIIMLKTICESL